MPDQPVARVPLALARHERGQALVLYALFLLVLLGASAIAIDYANWLLIDRRLQNVADHASLAGAAMFEDQFVAGSCAGVGQPQCDDARAQAWASLNEDLNLGLSGADITTLAGSDTPVAGQTTIPGTSTPLAGEHTIWVTTPPPANSSYQGVGGRYALNYAVVFVRVDEPTSTYFARALGFVARDRIGWATAGPLPADFALEVFCRNNILPEHGACGGSGATSLVIDGQGGVRLVRGDIGSNESLKVTATNGQGVIVQAGNVFVVEGSCSAALWRCPNGPPSLGGISDGTNGKNAFFMPPQPVPQYQSPLWDVTVSDQECTGANASNLCVPYRPFRASPPQNQPGDWTCDPSGTYGSNNLCGTPVVSGSSISCEADIPVGVTPSTHLIPSQGLDVNQISGNPVNTPPRDRYLNIDDDPETSPAEGDAVSPPPATPVDFVHTSDLQVGASRAKSFEVALRPPFGRPGAGTTYLRFVAFKTLAGAPNGTGNQVDLEVELFENGTSIYGPITVTNLPGTPTRYDENDPLLGSLLQIPLPTTTNFNALSLKFTFSTLTDSGAQRGGAIAWAEVQTPPLNPAIPPMIPPGYYHSITIADRGCAIMDPTAEYYGYTYPALHLYQKPGIYRFGGGSSDAKIDVGDDAFLIGDGVTLVFDPDFPDPTGGRGIIVGDRGALVLNTMRVPGQPPCTFDAETTPYNPSRPLLDPSHSPPDLLYGLPYSSVCAAWAVDSSSQTGPHAGTMLWTGLDAAGNPFPYCADLNVVPCVSRDRYGALGLPDQYRGITFYFTPDSFPASAISRRFQMSAGGGGCTGSEPGIAFKGVLYAPYDDVIITGGSSFATVGQVLAWTAKFNGACAAIDLDYPYDPAPAPPYLLEPGIGQ